MSKLRKVSLIMLKVFLALVLFRGVERFCHGQTEGFEMSKILPMHPPTPLTPSSALSEEERQQVQSILSQPFYFLSKGGQSFAFLSQDGKVVLKFLKKHHVRMWEFLNSFTLPSFIDSYRQKILRDTHHKSPFFLRSCEISYADFKEGTGLIYLHMEKTDYFAKKLTIVDKLGIAYPVDMDSIEFALQTKAELVQPLFKRLIEENDLPAAKECLTSLLELIVERCHKGIHDRDPNIRTNFGFIGHKAITIDIGSFSRVAPASVNVPVVLASQTEKFKKWLIRKNPELAEHLRVEVERLSIEASQTENPSASN
ncbi:MAG: hypothetical protein NTX49_08525 [Chlamydiae bacterium]|nr:hypothetical protein [Chlamydiota bacterium]